MGDTINRFLAAMPALCPLIQIIKSFVNQRNMNEVFSGGLGSYSIVCLVVSFLQVCLDIILYLRGDEIAILDAPKNPERRD